MDLHCPVCQANPASDPAVLGPCGHVMCTVCLCAALEHGTSTKDATCPTCEEPVAAATVPRALRSMASSVARVRPSFLLLDEAARKRQAKHYAERARLGYVFSLHVVLACISFVVLLLVSCVVLYARLRDTERFLTSVLDHQARSLATEL